MNVYVSYNRRLITSFKRTRGILIARLTYAHICFKSTHT